MSSFGFTRCSPVFNTAGHNHCTRQWNDLAPKTVRRNPPVLVRLQINPTNTPFWNHIPDFRLWDKISGLIITVTMILVDIWYDIFVNRNWVVTRWQKYSTHLHTNNTQNDTKQTIHRTTQQFWKSAGRAPSWLVIPWHLPYNRGKSTENPQSG